jgi:hypothetical protein
MSLLADIPLNVQEHALSLHDAGFRALEDFDQFRMKPFSARQVAQLVTDAVPAMTWGQAMVLAEEMVRNQE